MDDRIGFVLKVVLASGAIAYGIKYGGPYLPLPHTPAVALALVLLPTLVLAGLLGWKATQS
jgi:hypothetical protein